ncbi:urease accessory protein UreF [Marinomonas sp. S3726]|uniref:urease accessory protein UreF n=1 Tax=Marinomonas sp. S3726 TaxID=579484 RepID=UPI00061E1D7D|nr:urease accessory protein UreF [Marinomonas sp. S3726]
MLTTDTSLLRLLQLSSASLPVGGYSFSQGMEFAIDLGLVQNQEQVHDWIKTQLEQSVSQLDLAILCHAIKACKAEDWNALLDLNQLALACRESKELRLTDTAMGEALGRLLTNLEISSPFKKGDEVSFVSLFALACVNWQIDYQLAALGFSWSWLENQVAAATKLVPLGQTQAQILLGQLQAYIPAAINHAQTLATQDIGAGLPMLAILSARHEQQYSRLFRS